MNVVTVKVMYLLQCF